MAGRFAERHAPAAGGGAPPAVLFLSGPAATEGAFKREAGNYRIIHAATHGFFDLANLRRAFAPPASRGLAGMQLLALSEFAPSAPATSGGLGARAPGGGWNPLLLSGLVFAGANANDGGGGEDGWLTAEEVQALDLVGVDLVVLSACETGRGETAAGEGVLGLSRALAIAGARSFVLSLWKVPDAATQEWMAAFYGELWGETPRSAAEAARAAQLRALAEDRANGRFAPSGWGAWVAIE